MKKVISAIVLGITYASFALAAPQGNPNSNLFVSFGNNDFNSLIVALIRFLLGISGLIAMLYIIYGGYQFLTAGMNSDLAKAGKQTLRNAIIGLIIVILSYIIVTVVVNSLTNL